MRESEFSGVKLEPYVSGPVEENGDGTINFLVHLQPTPPNVWI